MLLRNAVIAGVGKDAFIATMVINLWNWTVDALWRSTALTDKVGIAMDFLVNTGDGDGNGGMFREHRGAALPAALRDDTIEDRRRHYRCSQQ
jgi:hypothetical protein